MLHASSKSTILAKNNTIWLKFMKSKNLEKRNYLEKNHSSPLLKTPEKDFHIKYNLSKTKFV